MIHSRMAKGRVILDRRFIPKDTVIIKEGDEGYSAYLVQSGQVSVYSKHDGKEVELARLGVGEICGEMALISDGVRSANVRALEDSTLIVITRPEFEDKLDKSDKTIQAVIRMLIERMKSSNNDMLDKKTSITDLVGAARTIYNNTIDNLDEKKAREFEHKVRPKLEALVKSIEPFI